MTGIKIYFNLTRQMFCPLNPKSVKSRAYCIKILSLFFSELMGLRPWKLNYVSIGGTWKFVNLKNGPLIRKLRVKITNYDTDGYVAHPAP